MKPMYPVVPVSASGGDAGIPGNDSKHDFSDPNGGGGPVQRTAKIPPKMRGGTGHHGQKATGRARMSGGRSGSGNPASRGGFSGEARGGSFTPETRVPGHGGSPQHRERHSSDMRTRGGGFGGHNNSADVSDYSHSNPQPGAGNTGGRSYKLIAGRFKRAAMKGGGGGDSGGGSYGGNPVTD